MGCLFHSAKLSYEWDGTGTVPYKSDGGRPYNIRLLDPLQVCGGLEVVFIFGLIT